MIDEILRNYTEAQLRFLREQERAGRSRQTSNPE
jgi:hypothetical protein